MDVIDSFLSTAAVRGSVAATVRAGADWGLRMSEVPGAAFHAITSGAAHLKVQGHRDRLLVSGDVVLLPSGVEHELASGPDADARPFDHVRAEAAVHEGGDLVLGRPPVTTQVVCASYDHDPAARLSPFTVLPDVVHIPALAAPPGLRASLTLINDELASGSPGIRAVLDHAVNIVLIQVLRAWIADASRVGLPPSWLRGLADPTTSRALTELHADPAHPWTATTLASRVGVSRSTLARRFESEVGTTPVGYLSAWRMEVAARTLRTGDDTIGSIARSVGYQSEYAFNRAFSRHYGTPPGRYRSTVRGSARESTDRADV